MVELAEHLMQEFSEYVVILFDVICICVMLYGGIRSLFNLFRGMQAEKMAVKFNGYMNMALLFKLGGEIVKLTIVQSFMELGIVAGIVVLHFAIAAIIQWEDKHRHHNHPAAPEQEPPAEPKAEEDGKK